MTTSGAIPTPCADWDVRALVNHVVGEDRWTAPLLGGSTIAEVGDRFDGDLLGADPAASANDAAAEAVAAVGHHLPTGGKVHLSYGDEDMAEYVRQLAADHLIHAWDVAAATGGDTSLDAERSTTWRRGSPSANSCIAARASSAPGSRRRRTTRQTVSSPRSAATHAHADGEPSRYGLVIGACACCLTREETARRMTVADGRRTPHRRAIADVVPSLPRVAIKV